MKVVGLVSGGKDSIFNLIECVAHGHEIVCIANLRGETTGEEMDSYMY
jgi:diphthine-ammonia ligase